MDALHTLIAAFNRGSLDVPADLFTARTTFLLNNRTYESILGGSEHDPLIRLLARGAAGYRSAARALQYALQVPVVTLESLSEPDPSGVREASLRIEGRLRDSDRAFASQASVRLTCVGRELASVAITCPDADLVQIAAARRSA